jgi:hypothetical protein
LALRRKEPLGLAWFALNLRTTSERTSLRREAEPTDDAGIEGQFNLTAVWIGFAGEAAHFRRLVRNARLGSRC